MFEELTWGQYQDWRQVHRQFNIGIDRLDLIFAKLCVDHANVHKAEGETDLLPVDLLPWMDEFAGDENLSDEELREKIRSDLGDGS